MKVYAYYYEDQETGIAYRWNTILQFGESWDVIGTVIMKNPGSAAPLHTEIPDSVLEKLRGFDASGVWHEFIDDNTMQLIGPLFAEKLGVELNGVIRVFNLFNIKDQKLSPALDKLEKLSQNNASKCYTVDEDIKHLCNPVYIGWGDLWKHSKHQQLKSVARKYFDVAAGLNSQGWYLSPKLEDKNNNYYHPQWLMGQGVHSLSSLLHRAKFRVNSPSLPKSELEGVMEALKSYSKTHINAIKALEKKIAAANE